MNRINAYIVVFFLALAPAAAHAQTALEDAIELSASQNASKVLSAAEVREIFEGATYYYLSNSFLGVDKVMTLDSKGRLIMARKNPANDNQKWAIVSDPNGWKRIYNKAQGKAKALDSDQTKPHLANKGNYSGQFWKLEKTGNGDWFRIYNSYLKQDKVLDTYNRTGNDLFFEQAARNTSGTYWRMDFAENEFEPPPGQYEYGSLRQLQSPTSR